MKSLAIGLAAVAAVCAVLAFFLQGIIFPPVGSPPPASLLPLFILLSVIDYVGFGVGVAFAIYLAMNYSKLPASVKGPLLVLFALALWLSISAWVHDGMHQNGADAANFQYLLVPEYLWHAPAALIIPVVVFFTAWRFAKEYKR